MKEDSREEAQPQLPDRKPGRRVGNFVLCECFGAVACCHGHEVRLFNIGRGHWWACDQCRTCVLVGSNLMSTWRYEEEATWRKNAESIRGYRQLK